LLATFDVLADAVPRGSGWGSEESAVEGADRDVKVVVLLPCVHIGRFPMYFEEGV
jgi:hypothetical protein